MLHESRQDFSNYSFTYINTGLCISVTVISINCSPSKHSLNTLPTSRNTSFRPPPRAPITTETIVISYPSLFSHNSNGNGRYFAFSSFLFAALYVCCGHTISQTQILFHSLFSSVKSGFLDVVLHSNSKSQTNVALLFSNTCPTLVLASNFPYTTTYPYFFAHAIAITINAPLCLAC